MSCAVWRILRRPEYREDLDAIEAWIARDNPRANHPVFSISEGHWISIACWTL